jgi:hypothetical protein
MSAVTDWIINLKSTIATRGPGHFMLRRLLVPGLEPLHHEGFIQFQGIESVYRPGHTPEAMSVMRVGIAGPGPEHMSDAELAAGIGAVLTLITDRRVEVLEELPTKVEGSSSTTFIGYNNMFDRRLVAPFDTTEVDECLKIMLGKLVSLPEEDQVVISSAIDLHYGSVLLFEQDLSAAYTLVVAGVEALSRRFGSPPRDWPSWEDAVSWEKFARHQKFSSEQYGALKSKLMGNRQLRLKATFVNYVIQNLSESFWDQEWNEWSYHIRAQEGAYDVEGSWIARKHIRDFVTRDREVLGSALRNSYDARSGFVHSGNRTINMMSEFYSLTHETSFDRPLSYAILRSILAELIKREIDNRAGDFELPGLVITQDRPS